MSIIESLQARRTYYDITNTLPVPEEAVVRAIEKLTELVPDAFNMKSSRAVVLLGGKHELLWDTVFAVYGGKGPREKIDSFCAGAGTILYFYDEDVVRAMQASFPAYADNFPGWALQSSGMLQISVWCGLRELGVGASVQHYNPLIDKEVYRLFDIPRQYRMIAQMPFGGIGSEPGEKQPEDISERVLIKR